MEELKRGDEIKLLGDKTEKIWYFVTTLEYGYVSISDDKSNLHFGNKFVDERWIKR